MSWNDVFVVKNAGKNTYRNLDNVDNLDNVVSGKSVLKIGKLPAVIGLLFLYLLNVIILKS